MASLDRLDWAAELAMETFGVRVGIRTDDEALMTRLQDRLPPQRRRSRAKVVEHLYSIRAGGRARGSRVRRFFLVYNGHSQTARTLDEQIALDAFEGDLRADVATSAASWVFVHAGVVGWKGRAIVIPAPTMHGKSRLVEALVRAGATYYSDEFAVLDRRGLVHPFAKALTPRADDGTPQRIAASELGRTGIRPIPIGWVVATQYQAGEVWQPRRLTSGEGLFALLGNTVRARIAPAYVLKTLARALEGAVALDGPRGDAGSTAGQILNLSDSRRRFDELVESTHSARSLESRERSS